MRHIMVILRNPCAAGLIMIWMHAAFAGYRADFVPEVLVEANPQQAENRMTTDSSRRIEGVRQFFPQVAPQDRGGNWTTRISKVVQASAFQRIQRLWE